MRPYRKIDYRVLFADYTHIIYIGNEDLNSHTAASVRYSIGGEGYVDPYVPFDLLFDVADDGTVTSTHVHIIAVSVPTTGGVGFPGDAKVGVSQ